MGVASHLHNCPGERRESTQSTDLLPQPQLLSPSSQQMLSPALSLQASNLWRVLLILPSSAQGFLPPSGSQLTPPPKQPLNCSRLTRHSSSPSAQEGHFRQSQGARPHQWAWGPARPGGAQFTP